jgi:hypothetical protein
MILHPFQILNFWKSFFPYFLAFFIFNPLVCHVCNFGRPCFDVYFEPTDTGHMKIDDSIGSTYLSTVKTVTFAVPSFCLFC